MFETKEHKKQTGDKSAPAKSHHSDSSFAPHPCGGCNLCHQMTRIHSTVGPSIFHEVGAGMPYSNLQKPCATNFFQRNLGNSYLQSMTGNRQAGSHATPRNGVPIIQRKCACGGSCANCVGKEEELSKIQTKLTVSSPNDIYEREADRVAEQIMRMPEPQNSIQEKGSCLDDRTVFQQTRPKHEQIHRQPTEEEKEDETLEAKSLPSQTPTIVSGVETKLNALRGGGQPLLPSTRMFFEPRFSYDFSSVRIHTDALAVDTTRALNARAFTFGRHIAFGEGQYVPGTAEGRQLLAHELTHVIQQGGDQRLMRQTTEMAEEEFILGPPEQSARIPKWVVQQLGRSEEGAPAEEKTTLSRKPVVAEMTNSLGEHPATTVIFRQLSGPATGNCSWTCPPAGALPYSPVSDASFNCYAYALDSPGSEFLQPGQIANTVEYRARRLDPTAIAALGGHVYSPLSLFSVWRTAREHLMNNYFTPNGMLSQFTADLGPPMSSNCLGCCTGSKRKIVAVTTGPASSVGLKDHWDFHWYRKDADKAWSHKPGSTPSTRADSTGESPICSPCRASRGSSGYDYQHVVGAWCI